VGKKLESMDIDAIVELAKEAGYTIPIEKDKYDSMIKDLEDPMVGNLDITLYLPSILDKVATQIIGGVIAAKNAGIVDAIDASKIIYTILEFSNVDDILSEIYGDAYVRQPADMQGYDDIINQFGNFDKDVKKDEEDEKNKAVSGSADDGKQIRKFPE
jgi:hypothetical protein